MNQDAKKQCYHTLPQGAGKKLRGGARTQTLALLPLQGFVHEPCWGPRQEQRQAFLHGFASALRWAAGRPAGSTSSVTQRCPWSFFCLSSANFSFIPSEQELPTESRITAAPKLGRGLEPLGARRGWESGVCSTLRREGKGETLFLSVTICTEDKSKVERDSPQRWQG